ncbi:MULTISPECIES: hypothetical protein [unclassified Oceanispirochaeta]|uniref:hypothetical protein n=1 Tax=unclassified Oceanispirochaeta TaxID=2635722 RepID=UPI000E09DD8E|nr:MULTISPECIES: hypothetical protein [unclassified Oceanispirochaeta]MBF9019022.1 hypothetical protein [Oceanispirochaeta sp. M2]NPD75524.1 hypothetical protein [Oceanispirochaeta sp. M1]RDG28624.1 hypothetical protein DV872_25880 [Oceanispirochaeta sp. M1]
MVLTKKYLKEYQLSTRQEIPETIKKDLLLQLGKPFMDDDGHVREYSEQDIYEQVRKAVHKHIKEVNF